jgi:type I restriction enzyme R subunit
VEERNEKTGKKKRVQIFPRYHQLDVVRKLLADAAWFGAGKRYLIQHSAGSGKSNSIAWLAHQLISLRKDLPVRDGARQAGQPAPDGARQAGGREVFDSIIVITDRRILDRQIRETIKGFA